MAARELNLTNKINNNKKMEETINVQAFEFFENKEDTQNKIRLTKLQDKIRHEMNDKSSKMYNSVRMERNTYKYRFDIITNDRVWMINEQKRSNIKEYTKRRYTKWIEHNTVIEDKKTFYNRTGNYVVKMQKAFHREIEYHINKRDEEWKKIEEEFDQMIYSQVQQTRCVIDFQIGKTLKEIDQIDEKNKEKFNQFMSE